jgi:hypothetical protein
MSGKMLYPNVGHVEVGRIDSRIALLPSEPRLVRSARIVRRHVGIQSRDDLHHGESLLCPIRRQSLKVAGPAQALAQAHPPRVTQPKERRAIRVFKVSPVLSNSNYSVPVKRVLACVSYRSQRAASLMQIAVRFVATNREYLVFARLGRSIANAPR